MRFPFVSATDAPALDALRSATPQPLQRPVELTRVLHEAYGAPRGYAFSWGQLTERASALPDPDTGHYTGISWTIIPTLAWRRLLPRLHACGWHLYHLLRHVFEGGTGCFDVSVPPIVYVQCLTGVELATLTTLCDADARDARAWLADQFVPHDLPLVLESYHDYLGELVHVMREEGLAVAAENGGVL